jgi:hypothetical protein
MMQTRCFWTASYSGFREKRRIGKNRPLQNLSITTLGVRTSLAALAKVAHRVGMLMVPPLLLA